MRFMSLIAIAGISTPVVAQLFTPIDDFESYVDDAALRSAWSLNGGGAPLPIFVDSLFPSGGTNAMRMEYDNGVDPFFAAVERSLDGGPIDGRSFWKLRWSQARADLSSNDEVLLRGVASDGTQLLFEFLQSIGDVSTMYELGEVNLTESGRYLNDLDRVDIFVRGAADGFGSGTLFFDDFELVDLPPVDVVIDDFESYADSAALQAAWPGTSIPGGGGASNTATSLIDVGTTDGQALRVDYNNGADPFFSQTAIDFGTPQDFSIYDTITVHYQPYFDGPPFANSLEDIEIKLESSTFSTIVAVSANQGTQAVFFEDSPLVLDLTEVAGAELQDVQRIALSIVFDADTGGSFSFGQGTVLFDNITASLSMDDPLDIDDNGTVDNNDILTLLALTPLQVIEDFDGFVNTTALVAATSAGVNTVVTLSADGGSGGTQAMEIEASNNVDPFFSSVTLDVTDTSLEGVDTVFIRPSFIGGSGEILSIDLLDEFGGVIQTADLGSTQALGGQLVPIDTGFTNETFFSVRFGFSGSDFGVTTIRVDDIRSGDSQSDFNGDGVSDFFDLLDYLAAFDAW